MYQIPSGSMVHLLKNQREKTLQPDTGKLWGRCWTSLIEKFIKETGCGGVLANCPASGTAIIEKLNDEHHATKFPIVYTSADSVFQIALDTDMIPLETLYKWCEIARKILDEGGYNVSRVIARPYKIIDGKPTRISKDRRDYSMQPKHTLLNDIKDKGGRVIGIGKIEDIFSKSGITHAIHTGSNKEGLELTLQAVRDELPLESIAYEKNKKYSDFDIIFTNLVDTDMLFGHRNNAKGYGEALEEIDRYMTEILASLQEEDLLIVTADHGNAEWMYNEQTHSPQTAHTTNQVPFILVTGDMQNAKLKSTGALCDIAPTVLDLLGIKKPQEMSGESLIEH